MEASFPLLLNKDSKNHPPSPPLSIIKWLRRGWKKKKEKKNGEVEPRKKKKKKKMKKRIKKKRRKKTSTQPRKERRRDVEGGVIKGGKVTLPQHSFSAF